MPALEICAAILTGCATLATSLKLGESIQRALENRKQELENEKQELVNDDAEGGRLAAVVDQLMARLTRVEATSTEQAATIDRLQELLAKESKKNLSLSLKIESLERQLAAIQEEKERAVALLKIRAAEVEIERNDLVSDLAKANASLTSSRIDCERLTAELAAMTESQAALLSKLETYENAFHPKQS